MKNPNAVDNLTKRGADANPNGAPPYWQTSAELYKKYSLKNKEELQELLKNPNLRAKEVMIINDIIRAVGGKDKSIDRFQDRTDGKAVQTINFNNPLDSLSDEELQSAIKDATKGTD